MCWKVLLLQLVVCKMYSTVCILRRVLAEMFTPPEYPKRNSPNGLQSTDGRHPWRKGEKRRCHKEFRYGSFPPRLLDGYFISSNMFMKCTLDERRPRRWWLKWIKRFTRTESKTLVTEQRALLFLNEPSHPHGIISPNCSHVFKPPAHSTGWQLSLPTCLVSCQWVIQSERGLAANPLGTIFNQNFKELSFEWKLPSRFVPWWRHSLNMAKFFNWHPGVVGWGRSEAGCVWHDTYNRPKVIYDLDSFCCFTAEEDKSQSR